MSYEIFVEVPHHGRERDGLDSDLVRPVHQAIAGAVTCRIVVADDIEPAQLLREQDGSEMPGRECGNHWHGGQSLTQRQDGFDTFPRCHDILRITEQTTAGTQKTAQAVGELAGLATELKGSVAGFKVG